MAFTFSGSIDLESEAEASPASTSPAHFSGMRMRVRSSMRTVNIAVNRKYVLVDMDGSNPTFLVNVEPGRIQWNHNDPDDFAFRVPIESLDAEAILDRPLREVQIWLGNRLLTWGPITKTFKRQGFLEVNGHDCLWYFKRRNIGRPGRTDYLINGGFEQGSLGWTVMHASPEESTAGQNPTHVSLIPIGTAAGSPVVKGVLAGRLSQNVGGGLPVFGAQLRQFIAFAPDAGANPDGDVWTAAVYMQIDSMLDTEGMGLRIQRLSGTETVTITNVDGVSAVFPKTIDDQFTPISDPPIGKWFRMQVSLDQPVTGAAEFIYASVVYPRGVSRVDEFSLTRNERLEFNNLDQRTLVNVLALHLQDVGHGKSDLLIGVDVPDAADSTLRDREYLYSDYVNGFDAIHEFTELIDGLDIRVRYTPTTRTFMSAQPGFGIRKPNFALVKGRNFEEYSWGYDGESAANLVVALGNGSGSAREEGWVYEGNHVRLAGGGYLFGKEDLVLEEVFNAPPDTFVDLLERVAKERYRMSKSPESIAVRVLCDTADENSWSMKFLQGVVVGDIVPVTIRHGALSIVNQDFRISSIGLNPDRTVDITADWISDDVSWIFDNPWVPHVD